MRFIGSKERLLPSIEHSLRQQVAPGVFTIGDLFCGTASVSRLFKRLGHKVVVNDNLRLGYVLAQAALNASDEPRFERLLATEEISKQSTGTLIVAPYDLVLAFLNGLPGEDGFFFQEYAPQGSRRAEHQRRYFSDHNARKIDAVRRKLHAWRGADLVTEVEHCLLLADLMRATNRVANIAGTYGCYIKHWDPRAAKDLVLERSPIVCSEHIHQVFC